MAENTPEIETLSTSAPAPAAVVPANVLPLDALRFLAALWVCLYHGVKFPGSRLFPSFDLAWDCAFFGGTGVLAFFVISGFCIHYPAVAKGSTPQWGSFLTRRFVRVILPYLAVLPFAFWTHRNYDMLFGNDLAWTILCDLAYYAFYPFLYVAGRKAGWNALLVLSLAASGAGMYARTIASIDIGNAILIPIFLPVWVMGCVLAEMFVKCLRSGSLSLPGHGVVFALRAAVLLVTPVIAWLSISKIIYWQSLAVPVSFLVMVWLWVEIRHFSSGRPVPPLLVWAGAWIYSLYLTHPITQCGLDMFLKAWFPDFDAVLHSHFLWLTLRFAIMVTATFAAAYLFAVLVEFPSHQLARWLSRRVKF